MAGKLFKEYYARLAKEGWIKAVLCGLVVGFSVMFVSATAFWMADVKQFWLAIVLWAVTAGATAPIFYYKKFQPTTKAIAKRVDLLGLEERLLTMTELEGDSSYIALRQREDAMQALQTVNAKLVKIAVSVPLVIAASVTAVFGMGMTTVSALGAAGVIDSGKDWIDNVTAEPAKQYELTYEAEEGGLIEGDMFQVVTEGEDGMAVMAVPEDEWVFVEWSDGLTDPYREDLDVKENITVTAKFAQAEDGEDEGEGEGEGDEPSDKPGEEPGEPQPEPGDTPSNGTQAGGRQEPNNQVIDGDTYYGDEYDGALSDAQEGVSQDGDLSEGQAGIVGDYFGGIQN
ncbi:MAG: hypothetical protein IJX87_02970 [Clostridia bacterium]|nr:hypothetical protein [Clostridia bacterium]